MSVNYILGGFATFSKLRSSCDDDWVDRFNHLYTVIILTLFAIFVGYGQFLGNPIECYPPESVTNVHLPYIKAHCWVSNTYYVSTSDLTSKDETTRKSLELRYYQWVPIILLFMALMFKLPSIIWRTMNGATGISLDKIVSLATDTQLCQSDKTEEAIRYITRYIHRWLQAHRDYHWNICVRIRHRISRVCVCVCWKRDGVYLTRLYIFIKLMYITVSLGQLFLLNAFLGSWFSLYGMELIRSLIEQQDGQMTTQKPKFPVNTFCDYDIKQNNNWQTHTAQCVLPYNILNERIFMFLWFWFVVILSMTVASLMFWIIRNGIRETHYRYVKKYLKVMDELHGDEDRKLARKFAEQYLRSDGIFVLRVVGKNSNEIVLGDIIQSLWRMYKSNPMVLKGKQQDEDDERYMV